jgi:hypothetical protein
MGSGGLIGSLFVVVLIVLFGLEYLSRRSRSATEQDLQPQGVRRSRDGR